MKTTIKERLMPERTCEIDGQIFEGVPCDEGAANLCQGCAGIFNPDVCNQLADCGPDNIIWIEAA